MNLTPFTIGLLAFSIGLLSIITVGTLMTLFRSEERMDEKLSAVDTQLWKADARFDTVEAELRNARQDIVKLQVSVARLEETTKSIPTHCERRR